MGRVAGLPEDKLPEFKIVESTPPTVNDDALVNRLRAAWESQMGKQNVVAVPPTGMGAEDFPQFTMNSGIPAVYWSIGGTSQQEWESAQRGETAIPSHHSPFFKVSPESVKVGTESTVHALMVLLGR